MWLIVVFSLRILPPPAAVRSKIGPSSRRGIPIEHNTQHADYPHFRTKDGRGQWEQTGVGGRGSGAGSRSAFVFGKSFSRRRGLALHLSSLMITMIDDHAQIRGEYSPEYSPRIFPRKSLRIFGRIFWRIFVTNIRLKVRGLYDLK